MRLKSDLLPALLACADGGLKHFDLRWSSDDGAHRGHGGQGLSRTPTRRAARSAASTRRPRSRASRSSTPAPRRDGSRILANGGRVLNVTAMAPTVAEARAPRLSRGRPDRLAGRLLPPRHRLAGGRAGQRDGDAVAPLCSMPCPTQSTRLSACWRSCAFPVATRRARRHQAGRARHLLAAHAAALPAQPHQPVADGEKDGWTIVDTGINIAGHARAVGEHLRRALGGKPVTRVVGTHMHPDHVGLAGWLCERWNAPL